MSRTVVYALVGGIGVFRVLPRVVWFIANQIHRYIHPDSLDAKDMYGQQRRY